MKSLAIDFCGSQLAVHTNSAELNRRLASRFPTMVTDSLDHSIGALTVVEHGDHFFLRGEAGSEDVVWTKPNVLERLCYEVAQKFIEHRPDLMWFHAGAVARGSRAIVLPGPWGVGKSTLTVDLAFRGWKYFSDDVLPWEPESMRVLPFPRTPMVRRRPGESLPRDRVPDLPKDETVLDTSLLGDEPAMVSAVVFPEFNYDGPTELTPCTPAEAVVGLLRNCVNFSVHGSAAVRRICRSMESIQAYRLRFREPASASEAFEEFEVFSDLRNQESAGNYAAFDAV